MSETNSYPDVIFESDPLELIASMANELRTPLTTIQGYALIMSQYKQADSTIVSDIIPELTLREGCDYILNADKQLLELVGLMLQFVQRRKDLKNDPK
jgi:signal transduction histidine kinase